MMCFVHYGQTSPLWTDKGNCSRGPWFVQQSWQLISACSVLWHKCCGCIWCIWASGPNCYLCFYCVWNTDGCTLFFKKLLSNHFKCIKNLGFNTKGKQWLDDLNNLRKKSFFKEHLGSFHLSSLPQLNSGMHSDNNFSLSFSSRSFYMMNINQILQGRKSTYDVNPNKNMQSQQTASKEQGGSSITRP